MDHRGKKTQLDNRQELLQRFSQPLICLSAQGLGHSEAHPLLHWALLEMELLLVRLLEQRGIAVRFHQTAKSSAGGEAWVVVDALSQPVLDTCFDLQRQHPLGGLLSVAIVRPDGSLFAGEAPELINISGESRAALLCGHYADVFADRVAGCAVRALLHEVCVSPKPGLVDRLNNGAHRDMDIYTFVDSSAALTPYFRELTRFSLLFEGGPEVLLGQLRFRGILGEDAMLRATGGINTHKGMVFSMGIVCAAFGVLGGRGQKPEPDQLFAMCGRIAGQVPGELSDDSSSLPTAGREAFRRYGIAGVRGEAAAGFPSVRRWGYPTLVEMADKGCSLNDSGVTALLHLMAHVEDTNVLKRAGMDALRGLQAKVAEALDKAASPRELLDFANRLDAQCIRDNISPGGCADLLALSFVIYFLLHGEEVDRLFPVNGMKSC